MLLFAREGFGELPKDSSSFFGISTSSRTMGFFLYREQLDALLDRHLGRLFCQDRAFSLLGPTDDRFHTTSAQRVPVIPSSVSLAPPVSSPYLDANEEIDLQATGSLGC